MRRDWRRWPAVGAGRRILPGYGGPRGGPIPDDIEF